MSETHLTPEDIDAIMLKAFGLTAAEFEALSMVQKAQLAYDRGLGFAAHGTAAVGHDGKPVTAQDTKVLRPDFGKPNGDWHEHEETT